MKRIFPNVVNFIKNRYFSYKLKTVTANERAEMMRGKFYFLGKNVELYIRDTKRKSCKWC